ncbi:MAG: fibronectin type III domain-containing protein [Candidatus Nomurabacteria bacterium]|nr:MAG: fibronectin type III domain-containing protein [Candidatus Nomurabacteria bacterium]
MTKKRSAKKSPPKRAGFGIFSLSASLQKKTTLLRAKRKKQRPYTAFIPLYFGWVLAISLKRNKKVAQKVIKPFKSSRRYAGAIISSVLLISVTFWALTIGSSRAATYYWVQTDWSGGQTANTAQHPGDQTGWNEYSAADANLNIGTELSLTTTSQSLVQTSDADFGTGTTSSTQVTGSGSGAYVELAQSSGGTAYSDTTDAKGVFVDGNYAYIADGVDGLKIFDISNPLSPQPLGSVDTNDARDVTVSGNYAYLADYTGDVRVVDISNKNAPSLVGQYTSTGEVYSVYLRGSYLYAGFAVGGCSGFCRVMRIYVLSLADPVNPSLSASNVSYQARPYRLVADGDYLYGVGYDDYGEAASLNIYNIGTPGSISGVRGYSYDFEAFDEGYDVAIVGSYAYTADSSVGVTIIDISNPSVPVRIGAYSTGLTDVRSVEAVGTDLYIIDDASLKVLDVSNPTSPSEVSSTALTALGKHVLQSGTTSYMADGASGLAINIPSTYLTPGTFTSAALNTNGNTVFDTLSWNATVPGSTTLTVQARTSNDSGMSGAPDWSGCGNLTSGNDISSDACVTDGEQYIQYRVSMSTSDTSASPHFEDISIGYQQYPSSQTLTSSAFDSTDALNALGGMRWTENLPSGTEIKFQIRTAPDSSGSPGTWSSWLGPSGTGDYYTDPSGGETVNSTHTDSTNDQWMQYKVWLESSNGYAAPTLYDATMVYVVNAPPEFEGAPTATQQSSDGSVLITYSVRDPDGSSGSGQVTPSFEYSLNNGLDWFNVTTGLSSGATDPKDIDETNYTEYSASWNAKAQIDGTYSTTTLIRVTIDDGELANNTASDETSAFTLDVKDPVLGSPAIVVDARTDPASLDLSGSDDSSLEMQVSLRSDFVGATWVSYASSSTISLVTDPDTVYVRFRDAYKNTSSSASAVTPETPTTVIIRDISNVEADAYQLFISWKAVALPDPGFSEYTVYRSTDGTSYSTISHISDRAINYYLDQSVTADTSYWYKISSEDSDGNFSYYSAVVSESANGQGGTDSTPPTISNVATSQIGTQTVTITWETDELSDSTIGYSDTPADFGTTIGVATLMDNEAGVGVHRVILTGLDPSTTYYFRVRSEDPGGNSATDSDGGDGYTVTTLSGPAISNVSTQEVSNTEASISWLTDVESDSHVFYSVNSDMSDAIEVGLDTPPTMNHLVKLSGLTNGTLYYYYVTSGVAFDNNGGEYYSFVTTSDTVPPVLSNIQADPVIDTRAVVTWLSNERATSQLRYGTSSGNYTVTTSLDESLNLTHLVTLSNLSPKTTYYYTVSSVDASGNSTTSTEKSFSTLEMLSEESDVEQREQDAIDGSKDETNPSITGIEVVNISDSAATVRWTTSEEANSFIQFGLTTVYGTIYGDWTYATSHSLTLQQLNSGSTYHYRVISVDASGNTSITGDKTFTTSGTAPIDRNNPDEIKNILEENLDLLNDLYGNVSIDILELSLEEQYQLIEELSKIIPTPLISGEPRVDVGPTSVTIQWRTDKDSNALVAYASDADFALAQQYTQVVGDAETYSTTHSVTVYNLQPDTTYHYQVRSRTKISQTTQSADFSFTTDPQVFDIQNYAVEKISSEEAVFRWTTTRDADATVRVIPYRNNIKAVDELSSVRDDTQTIIHQVTVDSFESGVTYAIELVSVDADGNTVSKTLDSFVTGDENAPPLISQIQTDSALSPGRDTKVQTIISWLTNEPATSRVYYRQGVASADEAITEATPLDTNYTKRHVVVLTSFEPGSVYQFKVESTDSSGQTSVSEPLTILTPQQEQTVVQVILGSVQDLFGWLNLF